MEIDDYDFWFATGFEVVYQERFEEFKENPDFLELKISEQMEKLKIRAYQDIVEWATFRYKQAQANLYKLQNNDPL